MKVLIKEKISPHKSKTPEGYLICRDAILGRTGSQEYHKNEIFPDSGDDSIVNVIRDSKEVFSPEAIASFENKPVTCEHPDEDVTPDNYKEYSVGFVRDVHQGTVDGEPVLLGNLIITDADIINDIENGIRTELSCGYTCDITDEKQPRQVNIRGNHVALCEQGRAGIAKIVDSVTPYVKGLIFQSDANIPAMSEFDFDDGIYKVGNHTYILVFRSGTHATKQKELEKKYKAKNFEAFSTSLVNDKVDTFDFRNLKRYSILGPKLIVRATGYFGVNRITDTEEDEKMPKLPTRLKRKIQEEFSKKSTFVKDPNYDAYQFVKELGERFYVDGQPLTFTRESINGWNKMGDGMMRKDYTFSVDGYDNSFRLSVYADPKTYNTTEVNAYFLDSDTVSQTRENAINLIKSIVDDPKNVTEDSEGVRYLSQAAYNTIRSIAKFAKLIHKDMEDISYEFFGPGRYSNIADSVKDSDDAIYDTYRGYDIDKVGEYFEVTFDGTPTQFETYNAALEYIDDKIERTEAMLRDRAIRDREYSPFFKREVRKELARKKAEVESEEAPDDEQTRMAFRKTKNNLLRKLKGYMETARDE